MIDRSVQKIIADIAKARGEQFFPFIVQALAKAIHADITFIATVDPSRLVASTVAIDIKGKLGDKLSYDLKGTPCEQVADDGICFHDLNVQELYPNDELLQQLGINSYIGIPLHNSEGDVIGLLAALYETSLGNPKNIESLFLFFSGLISSELDRRNYLRDYKLAAAVIANVNEAVIITDNHQIITYVNPAFEQITGYSHQESVGRKPNMLRSDRHPQSFYDNMWHDIQSKQSWSGEIFNRRKNGEIYPEWLNINVIQNAKQEISHYVGFFSDITALKKTEDELNFQSNFDSLTQLPNMEQFIDTIAKNINKPSPKKFAVAIIDIDNFRGVNDSYGHAFGNRFLQKVAQRLSQSKRNQDVLSRFGGDQFPIIINDIDGPHAASKIIGQLQAHLKAPFFINNKEISITCRVGLSVYPDDSDCPEQLVSNANQALVHVDQQADSRYSFFAPSMREDAERRMYLKSAIKKSILQKNFELAFQPIIEVEQREVRKFEVLVRWQHEGQWISPAEFIPIAEEFDLIKPLGELVLEKSCQALQKLRSSGYTNICFAINRSVHEFPSKSQGADYWLKTLRQYDIPNEAICFEITESVLAPDSKSQISLLNDLKSAGCSLAIDDFGTGYSSLSYLRKFPVDILKIDRSFISDQQEDNNDWTLVGSIIAMAKALGQTVVAEGVETREQLQHLMTFKCDYIQGYLFSKPLAEHAIQPFIDDFDFADASPQQQKVVTLNQH